MELTEHDALGGDIVHVARNHLHYFTEDNPPSDLIIDSLGRLEPTTEWTETSVKACLYLPLTILHIHQSLIHE